MPITRRKEAAAACKALLPEAEKGAFLAGLDALGELAWISDFINDDDPPQIMLDYLQVKIAGPVMSQTPEQRLKALEDSYGATLRSRLTLLPAQRAGAIPISHSPVNAPTSFSTSATGPAGSKTVKPIGQYFQLRGLRKPAIQLFQLLCAMQQDFEAHDTLPKPSQGIQLLRLVAAPGMGKSTALAMLWSELYSFVHEHSSELQHGQWMGQTLVQRVLSSLKPECMLVFIMDLSKQDLANLMGKERNCAPSCVLALRMLYSVLHSSASMEVPYSSFLTQLAGIIPLADLEPLDVLHFVKAVAMPGDEESLVVFAFDEANFVKRLQGQQTSWLQDVFSAFVNLRGAAAGSKKLKMMPLLITASTLASATMLSCTSSGMSLVADVQLLPLSLQDMKGIVLDVCTRLGQDRLAGASGMAHIVEVLKFLGGNPRHLAWALACMSGSGDKADKEVLLLGKSASEPCPWLVTARSFDLLEVLNKLASAVGSWDTWLSASGDKVLLFNQIVAHAMLGRGVRRAGSIPHVRLITWQQVENAGVCLLVRTGCTISAQSAASSRSSSGGGAIGEGSSQALAAQRLSTVQGVLDGVRQHEAAASSSSPDHKPDHSVLLSPLLAVMALQHMCVQDRNLLAPPLAKRFMDDWRSREFSDLQTLLLKLELLHSVLEEKQVPLSELLPGAEGLPAQFSRMMIKVPSSGIKLPMMVVAKQLTQLEFDELCGKASYDGNFAFIGPGNYGPDSWLVLQVVDEDQPLLLFLQSKKRTARDMLQKEGLHAEADKCWQAAENQPRLMVYITDQQTDNVASTTLLRRSCTR